MISSVEAEEHYVIVWLGDDDVVARGPDRTIFHSTNTAEAALKKLQRSRLGDRHYTVMHLAVAMRRLGLSQWK